MSRVADMPPTRMTRYKLQQDAREKCGRAAREVLHRFLTEELAAPIDIELLATNLGFQIVPLRSPADGFSGLVIPRHRLIGVNANHHVHRQRFTIAHELSHFILRHIPENDCTMREIVIQDSEADLCASELLMPRQLLEPYISGPVRVSVKSLAKLFNVSEEAMAHKVREIEKQFLD
ncbi:MAG: ImmA/IrrE family metallo-endopeptidase [Ignavibacteriae bacterium]|nr:ImmA/IrrE family metallo-endopeptidase [Ignavibacteriota bacterium]